MKNVFYACFYTQLFVNIVKLLNGLSLTRFSVADAQAQWRRAQTGRF